MKRISLVQKVFRIGFLLVALQCVGFAQSPITYGQQISILKSLKSDLHVIGVMAGNISEKDISNFSRTAQQQGIQVFVAQPKDPREIPDLYKKLIREKKAQLILIPNADDALMLQIGYEYLKENAIVDKVGVCVPDVSLISQGAFCFITKENGKFTVYINERVSSYVGAAVPKEENPSINYVLR